jgi:hypothetical protein
MPFTISTNTRDTIVGISGIVFTLCAGVWTLLNYDVSTRKLEIEALMGITQQLSQIKLDAEKPGGDAELRRMLRKAYTVVEFKFQHIDKPWYVNDNLWMGSWNRLYKALKKASTDGWDDVLKLEIETAWNEILKIKKIRRLGVSNE